MGGGVFVTNPTAALVSSFYSLYLLLSPFPPDSCAVQRCTTSICGCTQTSFTAGACSRRGPACSRVSPITIAPETGRRFSLGAFLFPSLIICLLCAVCMLRRAPWERVGRALAFWCCHGDAAMVRQGLNVLCFIFCLLDSFLPCHCFVGNMQPFR